MALSDLPDSNHYPIAEDSSWWDYCFLRKSNDSQRIVGKLMGEQQYCFRPSLSCATSWCPVGWICWVLVALPLCRRYTIQFAEGIDEIGEVFETYTGGDLVDAQRGRGEQLLGLSEPDVANEDAGWLVGLVFQLAVQTGTADAYLSA